jgi:hypothetical protein
MGDQWVEHGTFRFYLSLASLGRMVRQITAQAAFRTRKGIFVWVVSDKGRGC